MTADLVLGALDAAAAAGNTVACLPDDPVPRPVAELATAARDAGTWLVDLVGTDGVVAGILTSSHDCLAAVFGAWQSGLTFVSLPAPGRGMPSEEYQRQIGAMCATTGAAHLLVDPAYLALLPPLPVEVHGYHERRPIGGLTGGHGPGGFVQFTSGSTGDPRGIELTLDALGANIAGILDWLMPRPGGLICSWLPLSHDMGFVGMALTALCAASPSWSNPCDLVLITPEAFLADPGVWLRACTEFRATSTSAPTFALRIAAKKLRATGERYDLSSLRTFVVGSEPVSAAVLRSFAEAGEPHGFPELAFCPGYGLAEAAVAVAIVRPETPWSSVRVNRDALVDGEWRLEEDGEELVSCGPPVAGVALRTPGELGELEIRSPSLLSGYAGDATSPLSPDGWLKTADLAAVHRGELYVIGRTDDVVIVGGRNLDARRLDETAGAHPALRAGNCVTVPDGAGRYVVVGEPTAPVPGPDELRRAGREIRAALGRGYGTTPSAVVFIERGTLPKTPSGKVRRHHLQWLWQSGELQVLATA